MNMYLRKRGRERASHVLPTYFIVILPGGKSGVLTVKILEMHEECTLCIAICRQLGQICADNTFSMEENADFHPRLKVLFAKETAAHLKAVPQDVIHIYPPW